MLKNLLLTAIRNFRRHKSSFLINVIGLSIGMACSILILLWVIDELQVDKYHEDSERIFRVMEHQYYGGEPNTTLSTPGILAPALKEEFPEIEYATTYTWNVSNLFTLDDQSFKESGIYARQDIFDILTIPLASGNKDQLFKNPQSIVISQELARKYFGNGNPLNEGILLDGETLYTVTGVFKNNPKNTTLRFDYILRFEDWLENNTWAQQWGNNGPRTLVKVRENTDLEALNEKIEGLIRTKAEGTPTDLFLYPYADYYLYGQFENTKQAGGRIDYVHLFSIVAVFVLLIACINFMNLSTARATRRAKEVGIRKSIGATKGSLIGQFMGESLMISMGSLLLSVLLVNSFLPVFNDLTQKSLVLDFTEPTLLLIFMGVALMTGLISGSYPALYLSSFEAVRTLKGTIRSSAGEVFARKGLVVFQFALSVVLIFSTLVIYKQIQFTQTKNLGYNKENLISFSLEGRVRSSWDTFSQMIKDINGVRNVSRASHTFQYQNSNTTGLDWPGEDPDTKTLFEAVRADHGLVETMDFEIVEGRSFSKDFATDTSAIILNQEAVKTIGYENPVGKTVTLWDEQRDIIGVVKDFHFQHMRYEVEPLFIVIMPQNTWIGYVRLESEQISETLSEIEQVYKSFNPEYPFNYEFQDEQYASLYRSEMRTGEMAKYFSIFAVLISCLGLFGLSAFTAEQRAKEIGIRKVLGASVRGLVLLLSKDFTKLVLIAILIGIPISWYLMKQWISDFAYQTEIGWWIFIASGTLALIIAWLTVSWQSIRAALSNPVESLKRE